MRSLVPAAAACALILAGPDPAPAAFVTVNFTAQVTEVSPVPIPGLTLALNDAVTGQFSFDTNALDSVPDPALGSYASGSTSLTIGSLTLSSPGPANQLVTADQFIVTDLLGSDFLVTLQFTKPGSLPGDSLPSAAEFNTFAVSDLRLTHTSGSFVAFNNVTLISASEVAAVPEPSGLALLGAGAVIAGIRTGSRRGRSCG